MVNKKMLKNMICILVLIFSSILLNACKIRNISYETDPYKYLEFSLKDDGTYEVSKLKKKVKDLYIPNSFNGKRVTSIADRTFKWSGWGTNTIETIIIQNGIETIGKEAFYGRMKATIISIPNSVIKVDDGAFFNTSASFELPKSIKYIGHSAFSNSNVYGTVDLDTLEAGEDAFSNSHINEVISSKDISDFMFYNCTFLNKLTLKEGVKSIDEYAFYNTAIEEINFPKSLETIGSYAFSKTKISEVVIDKQIEYGTYAFSDNDLKNVIIDNSPIPDYLFDHCNIENLTITNCKNVLLSGYKFANTSIKNIKIENCEVYKLVDGGILDNSNTLLTTIDGYNSFKEVNAIGSMCFSGDSYDYLKIKDNVSEINKHAFYGFKVNKIDINAKTIHSEAFYYSKMNFISIKSNVIEHEAFSYIDIDDPDAFVNLLDGVEKIGYYAFYFVSAKSLFLPNTLKEVSNGAFGFYYALENVYYFLNNDPYPLASSHFLNNQIEWLDGGTKRIWGKKDNFRIYTNKETYDKLKNVEGEQNFKIGGIDHIVNYSLSECFVIVDTKVTSESLE